MIESASLTERIEQCERILKENSKSQVFAALADALRLNGDLDQAFRVCRQGLRIHPDYGAGHLVMAKINLGRKMYDWAEQELNKAVELDGETRATEQLRVEILIAKGESCGGESRDQTIASLQRQSTVDSGSAAAARTSEEGSETPAGEIAARRHGASPVFPRSEGPVIRRRRR